MTIVAAHSFRHPLAIARSIFDNVGVLHPIVRIEKPSSLTGLAHFLADNIPNATRHRGAFMVTCYSGFSEAEELRKEASCCKNLFYKVASRSFKNKEQASDYAENLIKAYSLDSKPSYINDWDFSTYRDADTPESFWSRQAANMIAAGVQMVKIRPPMSSSLVYFVMES